MEQQQPEQAGQQTRGMQVITISRQYGSGGGEVAARLAQRLGWQLIDHEIVAPLPQRITYVARREGLDEAQAQARVQMKDRDRARYLSMHFGLNVNDALLYDLIINTGVLDLDSAVELICLALQRKASRLRITTRELGPAAGMQPYPGRPADIRPLTSTIEKENT